MAWVCRSRAECDPGVYRAERGAGCTGTSGSASGADACTYTAVLRASPVGATMKKSPTDATMSPPQMPVATLVDAGGTNNGEASIALEKSMLAASAMLPAVANRALVSASTAALLGWRAASRWCMVSTDSPKPP